MKNLSLASLLCLLVFYAAGHSSIDLNKVLEETSCPNKTDFKGIGIGSSESEALTEARTSMAREHFSRSLKDTVQIRGINKNEAGNSTTKTGTKIEAIILNLQDAKLHFSKRLGEKVGVVACMNRAALASFYRNKIASLFSFADKEFAIAEYLTEEGKKNAALAKILAVEDSLKSVVVFGSLLQALENDNSYFEKERAYWQKANSMKMQLQQGTSVYLDISASRELDDLGDRLAAQMQEKGCNCTITESKENADYQVTVKAKMGTCIDNWNTPNKSIYCYANASVTVNNSKYQKPININVEAKGGWMNGNKNKALDEAFKELVKSLAEKINQTIN